MPLRKNTPGCPCCCPECTLLDTEDFTGESSNWTVDSGTWTWGTNLTTTSNSARVLRESGASDENHTQQAYATTLPMSYDGTNTHYIYFFWANANNHLYIKVDITKPSVMGDPELLSWDLREVIGGVDSSLLSNSITPYPGMYAAQLVDRMIWTLCNDAGELTLSGYSDDMTLEYSTTSCSNSSALGTKLGFGTGDLNGETFTAYSVFAGKLEQYCPCVCSKCQQGTSPAQLQVVFEGISDGDCAACDTELNGTFILDRVLSSSLSSYNPATNPFGVNYDDDYCHWYYQFSSFCSGAYGTLVVEIDLNTSTFKFTAFVDGTVYYSTSIDLPWDCETLDCENDLDGIVLNLSDYIVIQSSNVCSLSGATATISVVTP